MTDYHRLIAGEIPPWVMRFIKTTGRGINHHSMIGDNDRILIGLSGGKDSLALALALSLRRKWLPINYELHAVLIDWQEYPLSEKQKADIREYCQTLDIPLEIITEPQHPESFKLKFNCYLCARNRRRILFTRADEMGISKIALGHHLDDLVETSLMNLCFRGNQDTMHPVQPFFNGKITIIRPMIEVHERVAARLVENYNIPCAKPVCPYDQKNIRSSLKPIVSQLVKIDRLTREHIYQAHGFSDKLTKR